ncbi:MAG: GDSL-type esterase/lipase family protein [Planctomycetota bacterium]
MKKLLKRLGLLWVATLVGLLAAEVTVRLAGLGEKGSIGHLYRADSTLGWAHRPDVSYVHVTGEYTVKWRFNASGIRRDNDVALEKHGPRIVVLGDSHTAGHGVEAEQTYAARLESLLREAGRDVEVLNFGVDGYTTTQEYLWCKMEAPRWQPDVVILGVYLANDLLENFEPLGLGGYSRPLVDASLAVLPAPGRAPNSVVEPEGLWARSKEWLASHSHLYVFAGNRLKGTVVGRWLADAELIRGLPDDLTLDVIRACQGCWGQLLGELVGLARRQGGEDEVISRLVELLVAIDADCRTRSAHCLVALIPSRLEVEEHCAGVKEACEMLELKGDPLETVRGLRARVVGRLRERGLEPLDLAPPAERHFARYGNPLYFARDWHVNAEGHELVAQEILAALMERGWVE